MKKNKKEQRKEEIIKIFNSMVLVFIAILNLLAFCVLYTLKYTQKFLSSHVDLALMGGGVSVLIFSYMAFKIRED